MTVSDQLGTSRSPGAPTGAFLRDLGRNAQGFRQWLVVWRGSHYRISWRREPAGFRLGDDGKRSIVAATLSIVVVRTDADGNDLGELEPIEKGLLEELQTQGRTLAAWSGS